jgi:hypothetical protein
MHSQFLPAVVSRLTCRQHFYSEKDFLDLYLYIFLFKLIPENSSFCWFPMLAVMDVPVKILAERLD